MIRTAILAGIFLVMVSIAYSRIDLPPRPIRDTALITEPPPVEPALPSEAAKPAPKRTAAKSTPARPAPAHVEAPVTEEPEATEPATAEPVKAQEPVIAPVPAPTQVAAVAPTAAAPVAPPAAPLSLLAPPESVAPKVAAVEPSAAHAPVPLIPPAAAPQAAVEQAVEVPSAAQAPVVEKQTTMTKAEDMPLIQVPQRPVVAPWEAPSGTTHNSGAALATVGPAPAVETPKFMTPQERSRELYRLARDMEDLFITKLTH